MFVVRILLCFVRNTDVLKEEISKGVRSNAKIVEMIRLGGGIVAMKRPIAFSLEFTIEITR